MSWNDWSNQVYEYEREQEQLVQWWHEQERLQRLKMLREAARLMRPSQREIEQLHRQRQAMASFGTIGQSLGPYVLHGFGGLQK